MMRNQTRRGPGAWLGCRLATRRGLKSKWSNSSTGIFFKLQKTIASSSQAHEKNKERDFLVAVEANELHRFVSPVVMCST